MRRTADGRRGCSGGRTARESILPGSAPIPGAEGSPVKTAKIVNPESIECVCGAVEGATTTWSRHGAGARSDESPCSWHGGDVESETQESPTQAATHWSCAKANATTRTTIHFARSMTFPEHNTPRTPRRPLLCVLEFQAERRQFLPDHLFIAHGDHGHAPRREIFARDGLHLGGRDLRDLLRL
jgi:hypothetical protein